MNYKELVFLCGARDFHAMDWYKSAKELVSDRKVLILTDLIEGEGFKKLINKNDQVFKLIILDKFLFKKQSRIGNIWRNIFKLLVFPFQVTLIKRFSKKHPNAIYHAHSMYYLFLGWAAGITYVGTPQGSDILIKPFTSKFYKYFTIKSLKAAKGITVDSQAMKNKIIELTGLKAEIIQNGIDLESINLYLKRNVAKSKRRGDLLSVRGFTQLYRIDTILDARNTSAQFQQVPINFIYPFYEDVYKEAVKPLFNNYDNDLGRVTRETMYELMANSKIVFSIPYSDSSPRSVYESIFCGCAVAIAYHPYYDDLPACMQSRIILIDLNDENWFDEAMGKAENITTNIFIPSDEAIDLFDQKQSFKKIEKLLFN